MEFEISEGKPADLIDISRIWIEMIETHANLDSAFQLDNEGSLNFQLMLTSSFKDSDQIVYIVKKDNELVGFLYGFIKKFSGIFKTRITAHVSDITIKKNYRRQGIGTMLMQKFEEDFAKPRKVDEISLNVHAENIDGLRFYNKLGFKRRLISLRKSLRYDQP